MEHEYEGNENEWKEMMFEDAKKRLHNYVSRQDNPDPNIVKFLRELDLQIQEKVSREQKKFATNKIITDSDITDLKIVLNSNDLDVNQMIDLL